MNASDTEWFIIVNPNAGSGKTMSLWPPAQKRLDEHKIHYRAVLTSHRLHATALSREAASKGFRRILGVGGDGTVHEIFSGILSWCEQTGTDPAEFTIGILPIGSGNDWIKSTGIPGDTVKAVEQLAAGAFRTQDVIRVESPEGIRYMTNVGGTGFDSHVCRSVNSQKDSGKRSSRIYINALLSTIAHLGAISVAVRADGAEVFSGKCLSIALGEGRYSGGGMLQTSAADLDDGLLDAVIIPRMGIGKIVRELPRLFGGGLHESKAVKYLQCRELEIVPLDSASEDIYELDGEIEGRLPLKARVTGLKINILGVL